MNCWKILGIHPTDNLREIKRAYAAKSKEFHPEEHPEEFRQLHDAYSTAMSLAKRMAAFKQNGAGSITNNSNVSDSETDKAFETVEAVEKAEMPKKAEADQENLFSDLEELADNSNTSNAVNHSDDNDAPGETEFDFSKVMQKSESHTAVPTSNAPEFDFGAAIQKSELEKNREIVLRTKRVLDDVDSLISAPDSNSKNMKKWREIFKSEDYKAVGNTNFFVLAVTDYTRAHKTLPPVFYAVFGQAFDFKTLSTRQQKGVYGDLYTIFEKRNCLRYIPNAKINRDDTLVYTILGMLFIGMRTALNGMDFDRDTVTIALGVSIVALALCLLFYFAVIRRWKNRYSLDKPSTKEKKEKRRQKEKSALTTLNPLYHFKTLEYVKGMSFSKVILLFFLASTVFVIAKSGFLILISMAVAAVCGVLFVYYLLLNGIVFVLKRVKK